MKLSIDDSALLVSFSFWECLLAVHGSLHIPLDHIVSISQSLPASTWKEFRAPGTFVPGIIKAGTYFTGRGKEFWYVTRKNPQHLTIELTGDQWARVVLSLQTSASIPTALAAKMI